MKKIIPLLITLLTGSVAMAQVPTTSAPGAKAPSGPAVEAQKAQFKAAFAKVRSSPEFIEAQKAFMDARKAFLDTEQKLLIQADPGLADAIKAQNDRAKGVGNIIRPTPAGGPAPVPAPAAAPAQ